MTHLDVTTADLEALADGVIVLDADRVVVGANRVAAALCDTSIDQLEGEALGHAVDPRLPDGTRLLDGGWHASSALRSTRAIPEAAVLLRQHDGTDRKVFVSGVYRRDDSGAVTGAVLVLRDTRRRVASAVSGIEIVSTVSHELRSPLTSVKGYTSLLLKRWDRLDDEQKKVMLEQVHHDADRVTRLVTELLDISRLESGRLVLRREMVDLAALAANVVHKVGMEYTDLEATVTFPDGFPQVYADPHKLEQVLTNLVENAAKYGSPTGMLVEGSLGEGAVTVAVVDRGEGIPEEDLPRVFDKFFRRDMGRPTGSGLGLWISRGLVEAHGGSLRATSKMGTGTTFSFTLPTGAFEELHDLDVPTVPDPAS